MDDKDFLLIKTLYEEQNITHTAKKLFISQPAISDRLKRLEAEFGCQLSSASPRIIFTSQGEMLVQYVNEADERYQKIRSALAKPVGKAFGSLSIACSNVFAKYHMPSLLSEFKKKYPAIDISLKSGFSTNRYKDFLEADSMSASFAANTIGQSTKKGCSVIPSVSSAGIPLISRNCPTCPLSIISPIQPCSWSWTIGGTRITKSRPASPLKQMPWIHVSRWSVKA
mgnify:CR=1 FL=1